MRSITVLYGTETGVAEEASEKVVQAALIWGYTAVTWKTIDEIPVHTWPSLQTDAIVLVCSTTGQGDIPTTMRQTWDVLKMSDAPDLEGVKYAVFGLGDSSYEKFNYTAKMLHNRLKQLDAEPLINRGLGDDLDPKGYDEALVPWTTELFGSALKCTTEPAMNSPAFIEAKLTKLPLKYTTVLTPPEGDTEPASKSVASPPSTMKRLDPYPMVMSKMLVNKRLTSDDHFQDVRHLELAKTGAVANYQPGDALGVYPVQPAEEVNNFLERMKLHPETIIEIRPAANSSGSGNNDDSSSSPLKSQPDQSFLHTGPMRAIDLFTHHIGVTNTAPRALLELLAHYSTDEEFKERLLELADPKFIDQFNSYVHREKRSVVEILVEFPMVEVPLDAVLSVMKPLRPRYFSIASSPLEDNIALTVAVLEFKTPYKRERRGLCSGQLADAKTDGSAEFQCFILPCSMRLPTEDTEQHTGEDVEADRSPSPADNTSTTPSSAMASLPTFNKKTPLIMIGPGTGIAPLRSLIRTALHSSVQWEAPIYLFNGCRFKNKDYLYADEWKELKTSTPAGAQQLNEHTAFSRDGAKKRYVQHLLVERPMPEKLCDLLLDEEAHLYLCGNSKQMPIDVNTSLCSLLNAFGKDAGLDTEDKARRYLNKMKSSGRYHQDTWSS